MNQLERQRLMSSKHSLAQQYAAKNWHVLPVWWITTVNNVRQCACPQGLRCKSAGKHPIFELVPHGHKQATTEISIINDWWTRYPQANIGIALAVSGLVALDIDPRNGGDITFEVLEQKYGRITSDVEQLTGGAGRHLLFLTDSITGLPGRLGSGIDVKHDGYILAEPSNHLSGCEYVWEDSSSPLNGCIPSVIPSWLRSFAIDNSNSPSQSTLVLSPALDDSTATDIVSALPFISSEDRDTWLKIGMTLHSTGDSRAYQWWIDWSINSKKFDARDQRRVWHSFTGKGLTGVGVATLFKMAQVNGWHSGTITVFTDDIAPVAPITPVIPDVPAHLLTLPVPMLRSIAAWMNGYSEEPQEQITVQACLALTSVLAGRLYRSEQFNNVSSAYFLTLASTGVGKNYVKTAIRKLLAECGLSRLMSGSGNTSAGAVFSALFESPTHIQITDEFGKHLQMARKQSNGAMADAFAVMTEAYSDATGILTPRNYSTFHMDKKQRALVDKKQVYAPAMTLFAFAAPEQVLSNLTTGEIDDGFLNRLVAVQATLPPLVERAMQHTPVLEEYKSWALSIRKRLQTGTQLVGIDTDYDQDPSPVAVSFSSEALAAFQAFKQEIKQGEQDGKYIEAKLVRRWRENALRIATGLAVAACPLTPVITFTIAQWAIDYVRYYGTQFMQTVAVNVADSDFHRLKLNVEALIIKAGLKGMAEWELTNCSRLFASTPPNHRDQVLDALQREKIIEPMSFKSLSGRGKPRAAWVATQFIQESNHESA